MYDDDGLTSNIIRLFTEPELRYSRKWYAFGTILAAAIGIVGLIQTQWFVSLLPRPNIAAIQNQISISRKRQAEIAKSYSGPRPPSGVIFHDQLFNSEQLRRLRAAEKFFNADNDLQGELKVKFGVSLRETDVVVVPSWEMDTQDNDGMIGITDEGWRDATAGKNQPDVGGLTIYDSDPRKQPKTLDGRPRIILNPNAFESTETLRLVVSHEMFHAMNIPGYYPCPLTFAQNDLTYLPEYRSFVSRQALGGWRESYIWMLAVCGPWFSTFLLAYLFAKCHRSVSHTGCA